MRKIIVILDPAHGKNVPGKRSPDGTHLEYKWSRQVCKDLKDILISRGFKVEYTNTSENEIGLSKRKQIANEIEKGPKEIKFLISLHNNAAGDGSKWGKAKGFEIFTSKGQTDSDRFADIIMRDLMNNFITEKGYRHRVDISDGDLDKEENFTVLMGNYSAVLIEWLFQDNPDDIELLESPITNLLFVRSIASSIEYIDDHLEEILKY